MLGHVDTSNIRKHLTDLSTDLFFAKRLLGEYLFNRGNFGFDERDFPFGGF
jgi:hypothetical protein